MNFIIKSLIIMHKLQKLFCCVLLSALFCSPLFAQQATPEPEKGILRVKLQPELVETIGQAIKTRAGVVRTGAVPLDAVHRQVKAVSMTRMFPYAPKYEERMRKHGLHLWYEVRYNNDITPQAAARMYKDIQGVEAVDMVVPMVLMDRTGKAGNAIFPQLPVAKATTAPFNDPYLSQQWHYHNDGTLEGSIAGSDINLYKAWEVTAGSPDVIVAIIDGGIDYMHEDLTENVWINEAELNGEEGVDDDGNGYIDDVHGWNFIRESNVVYPHEHGTHVAGTVGAVNNNGIGVAGVAGGTGNHDGVKMMSCQVFDNINTNTEFAKAIIYAANSGAVIAQCSWGWDAADVKEQSVLDAIDYFTAEAGNYEGSPMKGGLCIFATGNLGTHGDFYPAAYPPAVAVGAMGADFKVATYTNYGNYVDITAPGGAMDFDPRLGVYSTKPRNQYGYMDGTSMACPHVSGVAALILSKFGSKNYTNEDLRTRLLSSVHDIYSYNSEEYAGKVGTGYLDAALALKSDGQIAPERIVNYNVFPSQQEIGLEWAIPEDADDHYVFRHLIYWSDKAFTASSDLSQLNSLEIDTKFRKPGEKVQAEIPDLKSSTPYWVAIQAIDRWDNKSELSPVQKAQTNSGPIVHFDKPELYLDVNVADSYIAEDVLTIENAGEGLLKWTAQIYRRNPDYSGPMTLQAVQSSSSISSFSGNIRTAASIAPTIAHADYMTEDYPQKIMTYTESTWDVGETDTIYTNSLAQRYTVDGEEFPKGFNLTHFFIQGQQPNSRVILQVYGDSKSITTAPLLLSDTLNNISYSSDVPYSSQLYFAPGESFWLVMHVGSGNLSPLGIGTEKNPDDSQYCYYSSDMGNTWTLLEDVLKESNISDVASTSVWTVTAVSNYPSFDGYLTLTPEKGSVAPNASGQVRVSTTQSDITDGSYIFNMVVQSNETDKERRTVPVNLTVSGHDPVLYSARTVDFGDLFIGQEKTIRVEIINSGYGNFSGADWMPFERVSSDPQFEISGELFELNARAKSYLDITYRPSVAGTHTASITLTAKNDKTYTFMVRGIADEPAHIEIDPIRIDVGELIYGEAPKTYQVGIKNTGNYPLEYVFPLFSDDTLTGVHKTSHKYGYSYVSNLTDPDAYAYEWTELANATDIKNQFNDNTYWSTPVELGFEFPFYDKKYGKIYIGSYGMLSMTGEGFISACRPPAANGDCVSGMGLITAFGANSLNFDEQSKLLYGKQNGKFVVSYENALLVTFEANLRISFRIALNENGDIEYYYKDIKDLDKISNWGMPYFPKENLFVGCTDLEVNDPFVITDADMHMETLNDIYTRFKDSTAIKIAAPGQNMIRKIDEPSGVVGVGETKEVTLTVEADSNMYTGPLSNTLTVLSTDPEQSTSYIRLDATISGSIYQPQIVLNPVNLDFGTRFKTSLLQDVVQVKNIGNTPVMITDMKLKNHSVVLTPPAFPYELLPGKSVDAIITVSSDTEGDIEDELTIIADNGQVLSAHISAKIIGTPAIVLQPDKFNETLAAGGTKEITTKITNEGNEALEYTVIPNKHALLKDITNRQNEEIDYIYASSLDNENVIYEWEELGKEIPHYRVDYVISHDYIKVGLPEKVTFYGQAYDTLFIYCNGFITFQPNKDSGGNLPNPPLDAPNAANAYCNYIAPFWGMHSPAQTDIGGIYYEFKEGRMVVSFMDYNNAMSIGICFQAILYYDGVIKYQYKILEGGQLLSLFGIAGMENLDHDKGMLLPVRYVGDKLAVEFYPTKKIVLQPGESAQLPLSVNAKDLLAGNYQPDLILKTNVPGHENTILPVNLTVTGNAVPVYPEEVDFGETVVDVPELTPRTFEISNAGTAAFTITGFSLKNQTDPYYPFSVYLNENSGGGGGVAPGNAGARYGETEPIIVAKQARKFTVDFSENDKIQTLSDIISFTTDIPGQPVIEIPVKISVVDSPAMNIGQRDIELYAPIDTMIIDSVFTISNETGKHSLDYTISVVQSNRPVKTVPTTASEKKPQAAKDPSAYLKPVSRSSARPLAEEEIPEGYLRELKYGSIGSPVSYIGTGDEYNAFIASIAYTAPADGFNISAVRCMATIDGVESGDIKAEIRIGSSYLLAQTIGQGSLHLTDATPAYHTITLDRPVYINSNETFYVYLTFPKGVKYPLASIAITGETVLERYMAHLDEQWIDLVEFEPLYGKIGFIVSCLEKKAGIPWITIEDPNEGHIAKGEKGEVTLHVNAATARFMKGSRATVRITGTAPVHPAHAFNVTLDKNTAPEITLLTQDIEASENNTSTVEFKVVDAEKDPFEITLEDDPDQIASSEVNENNLTVTLAPKFGDTGERQFTVVATDKYGNAGRMSIRYYVQHTNRAPVLLAPLSPITVHLGEVIESTDMNQVFSDPDGDPLQYVLKSTDEAVGKAFVADNYLDITQKAAGETEITVTAYDPSGLSATTSFDLIILNAQNGASADHKLSVYPNPVVYLLNIRCPEDIEGETTFRMYDMGGNLVYAEKTVIAAGALKTLDLSSYPSGVYILEMEYEGGKMNTKVVKQ